jgi:formamidopyrimidine-DNA glycosylase
MEDPYIRLVLAFADGRELWFRDIRKFGRVGVARRDGVDGDLRGELGGGKGFKGFGPEPLDPGFTARRFRLGIRGRKGRLKPLLLDQGFLAGVGNIYADEALWAARLHPLRSASSLRPPDEGRLYREIRRILAEAVERRGSSIDDYTAPEGDGSMQEHLRVYQRTGEACFRCGHPVRRIVIGARSTHFCSWCQRLPAGDKPGAAAILRGMEPRLGQAPVARTGRRFTEIGGADGSLGTPTGSTTRVSGTSASRTERTKRAAATRRAAARASTGTLPDIAKGA